MSALRALAAALVVAFAVLCTPAALVPVLNSADLIVATAPVAVVALLWRRTPKTPVEAPAPRAASNRSLDGLDYPAPVPARRALGGAFRRAAWIGDEPVDAPPSRLDILDGRAQR